MTTERQAAKADAAQVDLASAERAADQWLALALRKLARDPELARRVRARIFRMDWITTVTSVLNATADVLEHDAASGPDPSHVGRLSDDGDATGGGPYMPGSAIEEFGGED